MAGEAAGAGSLKERVTLQHLISATAKDCCGVAYHRGDSRGWGNASPRPGSGEALLPMITYHVLSLVTPGIIFSSAQVML